MPIGQPSATTDWALQQPGVWEGVLEQAGIEDPGQNLMEVLFGEGWYHDPELAQVGVNLLDVIFGANDAQSILEQAAEQFDATLQFKYYQSDNQLKEAQANYNGAVRAAKIAAQSGIDQPVDAFQKKVNEDKQHTETYHQGNGQIVVALRNAFEQHETRSWPTEKELDQGQAA